MPPPRQGPPSAPRELAWLAALLVHALAAAASFAQQADRPETFYSRYAGFRIPFKTSDPNIRQLELYAWDDRTRTWQRVATTTPATGYFNFQAPRDGWYDFTVRTEDLAGRFYPPTLDRAQPGLRVCVDTAPPVVTLQAFQPREGGVGVKWDIRDDNPDLNTIRLDYRLQGSAEWVPLSAPRVAAGQYTWSPATNNPLEVRLQVRDLAGNSGDASTAVTPGAAPPGAPAVRDPLPQGPAQPGGGAPQVGSVHYVNNKRISLNYEITNKGKSGVAEIELWVTTDLRNWTMHEKRPFQDGPYVVEVKGEGRYGFTLVARSGVGLSESPPNVGDPPQVLVEVDLTLPVVRLQNVRVGQGADSGTMRILYAANDKNMERQPITLLYGEGPEGPWKEIATREENRGEYVWKMPADLPYQVYIKVEAIDRAGNVGSDVTAKPVAVDLSQPKVRVLGVGPGK